MAERLTTEEFIERARKVHGDKYDYSKVNYINAKTKVCIICHKKDEFGDEHGEFWQRPNNHLNGDGCSRCSKTYSFGIKEFIKRARNIHGDKYDYSQVEFKKQNDKIKIVCKKHGVFEQTVNNHLSKHGCNKCATETRIQEMKNEAKKQAQSFFEKVKKIHQNKYDYSQSVYVNAQTPIKIICKEHGEFYKSPLKHLIEGCQKCSNKYHYNREDFIINAKKVYGDKYDYSNVQYVNNKTKVCIICHEKDENGVEHGEFWQKPYRHIAEKCGCPKCKCSHLELSIRNFLKEEELNFEEQKSFEWLKNKAKLHLDFYLPKYNIAIECQGIQHFKPINLFGGENGFQNTKERDIQKKKLCEEHGIKILYFSNLGIEYPYDVIEDKELLLEKIRLNDE